MQFVSSIELYYHMTFDDIMRSARICVLEAMQKLSSYAEIILMMQRKVQREDKSDT